jgi:hypothetical protein
MAKKARIDTSDMRYLDKTPTKQPSDGQVIVHNHVRSTREPGDEDTGIAGALPDKPARGYRALGEGGFRAWTQKAGGRLEICGCGWSGLFHYRIKGR